MQQEPKSRSPAARQGKKNRILTEIAAILRANASEILKANEQDIAQAKDNGIPIR